MSARSSLTRLFALRRLQQEQIEAELRAGQQQRQLILSAAEECRLESRQTAWALKAAIEAGQRDVEISSGIALQISALRERGLHLRLLSADALVESASQRWHAARIERLQVESVVAADRRRERDEAAAREQKNMDGWFLMRRGRYGTITAEDENTQILSTGMASSNGATLAESKA